MFRIITTVLLLCLSLLADAQISKRHQLEMPSSKTDALYKRHKKIFEVIKQRHIQNTHKSTKNASQNTENRTLDSIVVSAWDTDVTTWNNTWKEEFAYNVNNQITTGIISFWSGLVPNWVPLVKEQFSFDTNSNLTSVTTSFQYVPNIWTLDNKSEYTYDSAGNLIEEIYYNWDTSSHIWINFRKYEMTYDNNQHLIEEVGSDWFEFAQVWINNYKDEFIYTNQVFTFEINWVWNGNAAMWNLFSKHEYYYDTMAPTLQLFYRRNLSNTNWILDTKYEYEYQLGMISLLVLTTETSSKWRTDSQEWIPQYKDDYQYGNNDNRTVGIYSEWNDNTATWMPYYKDEFTYEPTINFSDVIMPPVVQINFEDDLFSMQNMFIGYLGYQYIDNNWQNEMKALLHYSNYNNPLAVEAFPQLDTSVNIYPNPTKDIFSIKSENPIKDVELYSLLGEKIKIELTDFDEISMTNLSNGIYFLKIIFDEKSITKKIIKQ